VVIRLLDKMKIIQIVRPKEEVSIERVKKAA
jgi:hypothetical protein